MLTACITGTNGKTTTTTMLAAIIAASGETSARVTTLGAFVGDEHLGTDATSETFTRTVARAAELGVRALAIETTSEALERGFAKAWPATVGVFTNLSHDHLDAHGTPERYLAAKAQLFLALTPGGTAVLNAADPCSALLDEVLPAGVHRVAYAARDIDPACGGWPIDLLASEVIVSPTGTLVHLSPSELGERLGGLLSLRVVGDVHAENALAAALAADALGYSAEVIRRGLGSFAGVPGRFEIVSREPLVVVDYAHTPDALARTLQLARTLVREQNGRVIVVFGCGGDRDPSKRPEMGRLASELADHVVLTTDNPRTESPSAIAAEVQAGAIVSERGTFTHVEDRRAAIAAALEIAKTPDIVVIAGKGHERVQIVGDQELAFDDVEVARGLAARRERGGSR